MTEKPSKEFEPITSQEEFDERIKARLARERERWAKESGNEDLKAQLEAKDEELSSIKKSHAIDQELLKRGVTDETRQARIKRLVDFEGEAEPTAQLEALSRDVPELFKVPVGAGSGGSSKPVLPREAPLTREELEAMSESEINGRWDQIKAFMAGERG